MRTLLALSLSLGLVALPLIGSSESGKKSDLPNEVQIEAEVQVSPSTGRVLHSGFSLDDYRQEIVMEAYQLGGLEFVALLECENGLWDPRRVGDGGDAHGLCQLNTRWHKEPFSPSWNDWHNQLSVCFEKWKSGTKFYGPQRLIGGKSCSEVAKKRFMVAEDFTLVD